MEHGRTDADLPSLRHQAPPDTSSIIGYVTSGHFSLQLGKGYGLGAVSLGRLVDLARKDLKYVVSLLPPILCAVFLRALFSAIDSITDTEFRSLSTGLDEKL